jgi:hypothetical protein
MSNTAKNMRSGTRSVTAHKKRVSDDLSEILGILGSGERI